MCGVVITWLLKSTLYEARALVVVNHALMLTDDKLVRCCLTLKKIYVGVVGYRPRYRRLRSQHINHCR